MIANPARGEASLIIAGETLVLQDILGGHVDLFFGNVSAGLALWREGKIKVLAVLDKKRSAAMPDVPTTAEAGMPDLVSVGWFAVAGPPKMATALRDQIAKDFIEVLKMPDVQAKYRALSVEPGLNPYQPNQRNRPPQTAIVRSCGSIGPPPSRLNRRPSLGPRQMPPANAIQPPIEWTTVEPAKSWKFMPKFGRK